MPALAPQVPRIGTFYPTLREWLEFIRHHSRYCTEYSRYFPSPLFNIARYSDWWSTQYLSILALLHNEQLGRSTDDDAKFRTTIIICLLTCRGMKICPVGKQTSHISTVKMSSYFVPSVSTPELLPTKIQELVTFRDHNSQHFQDEVSLRHFSAVSKSRNCSTS